VQPHVGSAWRRKWGASYVVLQVAVSKMVDQLVSVPFAGATVGYEAAVMYASVNPTLNGRCVASLPAVEQTLLASFEVGRAARRFAEAVTILSGWELDVVTATTDLPRRFEIHHVHAPIEALSALVVTLRGWSEMVGDILASPASLGASKVRWRHRRTVACAAWRAALVVSQPVRRRNALRLRVMSEARAALLVRAARILDVHATAERRDPVVVHIANSDDVRRLIQHLVQPVTPAGRRQLTTVQVGCRRRPAQLQDSDSVVDGGTLSKWRWPP
jgi:hypothetical protein